MNLQELTESIDGSPEIDRAKLRTMLLYATAGDSIRPELKNHLEASASYSDFFTSIFLDENQKNTLLWAECATYNRRNWLSFFQPKMLIQNLRLKTDGLPIQMGSGVVLAPTGSWDNIANLYVFEADAFNHSAAEFVTSIGGKFTVADYEFFGIYGLYKYRGNVILEEWQVEEEPCCISA